MTVQTSAVPVGRSEPPERRINLVQGEYHVTDEPGVVLTTILGSCVAACLRDPTSGVGGMNHFLLPGDDRNSQTDSLRYGVHSMELLLNGILRAGGRRDRLEGKLFGGARMLRGLTDVGELNARFAEDFLRREGISLMGGSLRGDKGRRIQYWPGSGRARQIMLEPSERKIFEAERKPKISLPTSGTLELF